VQRIQNLVYGLLLLLHAPSRRLVVFEHLGVEDAIKLLQPLKLVHKRIKQLLFLLPELPAQRVELLLKAQLQLRVARALYRLQQVNRLGLARGRLGLLGLVRVEVHGADPLLLLVSLGRNRCLLCQRACLGLGSGRKGARNCSNRLVHYFLEVAAT